MKTSYRFIHFVQSARGPWACRNNKTGVLLGVVHFYHPWRRYVWQQSGPEGVFSADCLTDIAHFMSQLEKP
jgi:hypothetical protein